MKTQLKYFFFRSKILLFGALFSSMAITINILLQIIFRLSSLDISENIKLLNMFHPFVSSLATGFFEEFIFRVLLLNFLLKIFNKHWLIIIIGSLIFALPHAGNSFVTMLALISHFFGGVVYSYAYLKTREIWLPFGLHFGWNYTQILFGIPMSGSTFYSFIDTTFYSDEFLSGGLYGFEGGILSILSRLLLFLILYLWMNGHFFNNFKIPRLARA